MRAPGIEKPINRWSKQIETSQIVANTEADGWQDTRVMELEGIIELYNPIH